MFELTEEKNYWCIVSLTHQDNFVGVYDEVIILHESNHSKDDEIFEEGSDAADNGLEIGWAEDKPAGIYRLMFTPTYDEDGEDRMITGATVSDVTLTYQFPPSDSDG